MDVDITVGALLMKTGYTQTLTIGANHTLTVGGGAQNTSLADGVIAFQTKGVLNLANCTGNDSGTDIDSAGTGLGNIYVNNNSVFQFVGGPTTGLKLGANLTIGVDAGANASAGTVNFADYNFTTKTQTAALNGPVTLFNNVIISNQAKGVINFDQASNSATAGGIALDKTSAASKILNFGTINRNVQDAGGQTLTIQPTATGSTGSVVNDNAKLSWLGKYNLQGGAYKKGSNSLPVSGVVGYSGSLDIEDPGAAGAYVVNIADDLLIYGATVEFDITTPGATVTLAVAGNADITAGSISIPTGDSLTVGGDVNQSGGTVTANSGTVVVAGAYNETGGTVTLYEYGGALSVGGATTLSGGALQVDGGTLTSVAAVAVNGGTLQLAAGTLSAPAVQVVAGGVLSGYGSITGNVSNAGEVDVADNGALSVSGAYTQTAGLTRVGLSSYNAELAVVGAAAAQAGTIVLTDATLQAGGGLQIASGAALSGYGTVTGNVSNAGSVTVGGNGYASLRVNGNYTQTSGGALTLDLSYGSDPATLSVSGQANLDGAFTLDSVDGQTPSVGSWLSLVYYGSRGGQFATLNLPALSSGVWDPVYNDADGVFMLEVNAS